MRWSSLSAGVLALWLVMAAMPALASAAVPRRVVSVNLCADIFTLAFADRKQIASLSYVATHSPLSPVHDQALGIPVNHARIEEALTLQPDLVLAYQYANPQLVRWLRDQGVRVETLKVPTTLRQVVGQWLRIATLLGHPERARALARRMASLLAATPKETLTAAVYGPAGIGASAGSLLPALFKATGYRLLRNLSHRGTGRVDLELLLLRQPDVLALVQDVSQANTLAARATRNPVLGALQARVVNLPSRLWSCGGPEILTAIQRLEQR